MSNQNSFGNNLRFALPFLFAILAFHPASCSGEGIKQLRPDSAYSSADLYFENGYFGAYPDFGLQGCAPNYRLYIHIKSPGESILFGMRFPDANVHFNLRKPDGSIALTGLCPWIIGQQGYIRHYHQAMVGPIPSAGGYVPLEYKVTSIADTGNYYFELISLSFYDSWRVDLWDFQVVSGAHTPAVSSDMIDGRVWSQSWQFNAELSNYRLFNGKFFVYSDDGIVTKLTFDDARVGVFTLFCNATGALNTGNFINDRKSQNSNTFTTFPGIAQYKVFLNDPDPLLYPSGQYGQILGTPFLLPDPNFPVCSGNKLIVVNVNKAGKLETRITLPYGSPATDVSLYTDVVTGTNNIPWNGKDGQGNPVPDGTLLTITVKYVNGLTNLPIWDEEQNPNGFRVTLVRPITPSVPDPMIFWDDTNIGPAYNCPSGSNFTGCLSGATGCHTWSGQDCHDKMINSWWFGSTSAVVFTEYQTAMPASPVGHNGSRCGEGTVLLHATVSAASTVDWYAVPVGGTPLLVGDTSFITPVINTTTNYFAEARGDSSGCLSAARTAVTATVKESPHPVISGAEFLCLGPQVYNYTTETGMTLYIWSVSPGGSIVGGQGTSQVSVVWSLPGQQWIGVNYTNSAGCNGQVPTVYRVIVSVPPAAAGPVAGPTPVCAGTIGAVYLVEPVPGAIIYNWSLPPGAVLAGGGTTSTIVVNFLPDVTSGYISVNATNGCGTGPSSPPYLVTVNHTPLAEAGPDTSTCSGTPWTISTASATGYSSLVWSTDGSGTLTDETTLSPTYIPATGETGNVHFTFVAIGYPPCPNDTSRFMLTILPAPAALSGGNLASCGSDPVNILNASAQNYTSLIWTSSGTGTFNDVHVIHPVYLPSQQDVSHGAVLLTLTAFGQSPCQDDTAGLILTLAENAIVSAGNSASVCEGETVPLNSATAQYCTSVTWTTSGTGTFDNPYQLHPVYTPSETDVAGAVVKLSITGVSASPCNNATDTLLLNIGMRPKANAGLDGAVCSAMEYTLSGAEALNYSAFSWSHNGTGTLTNGSTLSPSYLPGPGESGTVILTLTATGAGSCSAYTAPDQAEIVIHQPVTADAGADQSIPYGTASVLTASAEGGSGFYAYTWEPVSLVLDPGSATTATIKLTEDVTFLLRAVDSETGCTASDNILIRVSQHENTEECLNIHNVITPNGDGSNDIWFIDCIESFPYNKVDIFNRWGDRVNTFEGYNNGSVSWKGTNRHNELLPDGTYYYVISIKDGGTHTGWVFIRGGRE